jgi:hypothetical protein
VKKTISTINLNTPCVISLHEKKKSTSGGKFETILLETVDEIFSSLGSLCKKAIYYQLDQTFKIKKYEIPEKIPQFARAIEQIFGAGAKFIEMKIIATLHEKAPNFMYSPSMEDLMFEEYVESMRRFFLITNCTGNNRLRIQRTQRSPMLSYSNLYYLAS